MERLRKEGAREKALCEGPSSLSAVEALALLLGTGSVREDVFALSRRLLFRFVSAGNLLSQSYPSLRRAKIGAVQAFRILAAGRLSEVSASSAELLLRTEEDLSRFPALDPFPKTEVLEACFLTSEGRFLYRTLYSSGSIERVLLPLSLVQREALKAGAAKVVLGHTHPSGSLSPSPEDERTLALARKKLSYSRIEVPFGFVRTRDGVKAFLPR